MLLLWQKRSPLINPYSICGMKIPNESIVDLTPKELLAYYKNAKGSWNNDYDVKLNSTVSRQINNFLKLYFNMKKFLLTFFIAFVSLMTYAQVDTLKLIPGKEIMYELQIDTVKYDYLKKVAWFAGFP